MYGDMDEIASVPSHESAMALQQAQVGVQVAMAVQKMAMDASSQVASQLLASLGVGQNLNVSA